MNWYLYNSIYIYTYIYMCVFCLSTHPSISRQNQSIHPCIRLLSISYHTHSKPDGTCRWCLPPRNIYIYIRFGSTSLTSPQTTLEPKGPSNLPMHQLSRPGLERSGYNRPVELSHNPHAWTHRLTTIHCWHVQVIPHLYLSNPPEWYSKPQVIVTKQSFLICRFLHTTMLYQVWFLMYCGWCSLCLAGKNTPFKIYSGGPSKLAFKQELAAIADFFWTFIWFRNISLSKLKVQNKNKIHTSQLMLLFLWCASKRMVKIRDCQCRARVDSWVYQVNQNMLNVFI